MLNLIRKRKINWLGQWLKKCLLKDVLQGMVNGRKVWGRRRYQMMDNIRIMDMRRRRGRWKRGKSGER